MTIWNKQTKNPTSVGIKEPRKRPSAFWPIYCKCVCKGARKPLAWYLWLALSPHTRNYLRKWATIPCRIGWRGITYASISEQETKTTFLLQCWSNIHWKSLKSCQLVKENNIKVSYIFTGQTVQDEFEVERQYIDKRHAGDIGDCSKSMEKGVMHLKNVETLTKLIWQGLMTDWM